MKAIIWTVVAVIAVAVPVCMYFFQRWQQKRAEREGVVVYATVVSVKPVTMFKRKTEMVKIAMWVQEPDQPGREITLRTRVAPGQKIEAGVRLCVVIDPKQPKRLYPASPEAMKRVVLTGPRRERRMMKSGRGVERPGMRRGGRRG